MKRLFTTIAATISLTLLSSTCSANADSLGIHKDCDNAPISKYGMDSITAFNQYQVEPKKFTNAMTALCNKGKTMGDMGFEAVVNDSKTESRKWINANLPNQTDEQRKFSNTVAYLLQYAVLNGYSGFDYPKPPEQNNELPATAFSPYEVCNTISSNAAEYSTSQLPSNVNVSLSEWKQIKDEFEMVCLTGMMNGSSRKPVDNGLMTRLNDISRDVYSQAYKIGFNHPKASPPSEAKNGADDLFDDLSSGNNTPKKNKNRKQKQNSSSDEIKQREEIQKYRNEISNAFESRLVRVPNSTGKSCSINVWISQKGEVLSTKIKSGDNSACSFALSKTKDIKLSPMSDNLYKLFRNTTIDFNL